MVVSPASHLLDDSSESESFQDSPELTNPVNTPGNTGILETVSDLDKSSKGRGGNWP